MIHRTKNCIGSRIITWNDWIHNFKLSDTMIEIVRIINFSLWKNYKIWSLFVIYSDRVKEYQCESDMVRSGLEDLK